MKNLFLSFINVVVLAAVLTTVYHSYIAELDNSLSVDCDYEYIVETNSLLLNCDVRDDDLIISENYPLSLYLLDNDNLIVLERQLNSGVNTFEIDNLDYNSIYSISVEGFDFITENYIPTIFSEFNFSTAYADIIIPTYVFTENLVTDTEYHFSIDIIDLDNCVSSIDISLFNDSNELIMTQNYITLENLDFSFTELNPNYEYSINIEINYIINDYDQLNKILVPAEFLTLDTQVFPNAELSNVYNDNVNLSFSLNTHDNDATNVFYTVELVDINNDVLYSEISLSGEIELDVFSISGSYYISVKASYLLNGNTYSGVELVTYNIYSNELSNFFVLPSVIVVNTDLPLTSYDDYANYMFTYFNQGLTEFSITCEAPINCSELVLNNDYSYIPFQVTDFIHAYNDINTISYSYTSTELDVTVGREYSIEEMGLIDQEIDRVLNIIITDSMTDYEKILTVHDYVVNNTVYDSTCYDDLDSCDNDHTAIGVLFDELAVCEGYAHTIDIMLRALQIPTFKISSNTHQWNAVYYDEGWYHLDATWDDPVTNDGHDVLNHYFFLINTVDLLVEDPNGSHDYITIFVDFME
jgi:hypothetical protein